MLDFFLYALPLLCIMTINNVTLHTMQEGQTGNLFHLNSVQLLASVTKLIMLADLALEAIMNVYEAIKLHHLKQ